MSLRGRQASNSQSSTEIVTRKRRLFNRFSLARSAFRRRNVELARAAHSWEHLITTPIDEGLSSQHLADAVLGATDGIVTTFAVVAGAAGASLSPGIVLVMGFANLVADGFSMSVGNYLGGRSQQDFWVKERAREMWEIENLPQAEQEEIKQIYSHKGFTGEILTRIVAHLTADKQRWADEMMRAELGVQEEKVAPLRSGAVTFVAFVLAGLIPLMSHILAFWVPSFQPIAFPLSIGLTAAALFFTGAARCMITSQSWWRGGVEILTTGGIAATFAFAVGYALRGLLD
jgi:VIT1/CCC1 family predicted Fe2+/Mn2+ transporter